MLLAAAQKIGAGFSTSGLAGCGIGIAVVFSSFLILLNKHKFKKTYEISFHTIIFVLVIIASIIAALSLSILHGLRQAKEISRLNTEMFVFKRQSEKAFIDLQNEAGQSLIKPTNDLSNVSWTSMNFLELTTGCFCLACIVSIIFIICSPRTPPPDFTVYEKTHTLYASVSTQDVWVKIAPNDCKFSIPQLVKTLREVSMRERELQIEVQELNLEHAIEIQELTSRLDSTMEILLKVTGGL